MCFVDRGFRCLVFWVFDDFWVPFARLLGGALGTKVEETVVETVVLLRTPPGGAIWEDFWSILGGCWEDFGSIWKGFGEDVGKIWKAKIFPKGIKKRIKKRKEKEQNINLC